MTELLRRINPLGIAVFVAGLALWELAVRTGVLGFAYLPPPSIVAIGLVELIASGELLTDVAHTLLAALGGWAIAAAIGICAGTVLGMVRPVWRYSMASIEALRALPIVAFVPVAVLLLGYSIQTEILVAFYAAVWPILLNTINGMRITHQLLDVGDVLRLSRPAVLWKIRLPAATPAIVVGLRLALAIALVLTLVAEMVGNPEGIGAALVEKGQALQPGQMFAEVFVIGLIGIIANALLVLAARLVFRGQMTAAGDLG